MIVCVIGLGLIGGSVATSLKNRGFTSEIIGVDSNEKHCKEALEIGFVNKILPLKDAVSLAQVILLTIPVDAGKKMLPNLLDQIRESAVIVYCEVFSSMVDIKITPYCFLSSSSISYTLLNSKLLPEESIINLPSCLHP